MRPGPCQGDHIVGAGANTDTASGTQFRFKIKVDRFSIPDRVDLLVSYRIQRRQFQRVNRARNHAVSATCAPVYVYMNSKGHAHITLLLTNFVLKDRWFTIIDKPFENCIHMY
jgi:hypothetical protein